MQYSNQTLSTLNISFQSIPLSTLKTYSSQPSSTHHQQASSPSSFKLFDDHRNVKIKKSSRNSSSNNNLNNNNNTTNTTSNSTNNDDIDWTRTDLPPPLSGHASCLVDCMVSNENSLQTNQKIDQQHDEIIAIMGGISIGFKRVNSIWFFSPKTLMIRKFDFLDPGAIVEFEHVANFIKSNNRKDELTYLNTYLNNLLNQILREDSLSNESLENSLKLFLKKKITNQKLPNMENSNKKLILENVFKIYQTKMVEFLKKISNLIIEELNQIKKNIPNIVKSPTQSLKYLFPIPRERHGMCKIPESKLIIIFGGIADKKIRLNDVWFLNLETMMWHEGKLKGYCKDLNENQEYSLDKTCQHSTFIPTFTDSHNFMIKDGFTMNLGIKIPTARYYHSITPINSHSIVLFGGYDGTFRNDMWILNILNFKNYLFEWKKIEYSQPSNQSNSSNSSQLNEDNHDNQLNELNIPKPRYNHWCGMLKDKLLLFGGVLEKGIQTNDCWIFDIDSYRWKNLLPDKDPSDDYPERRSDHKCVIIGKFLIIVGGVYKKLYLNNIFVLDLESLQWRKFDNNNNTINGNLDTINGNIDTINGSKLPARIGFIIQSISNNRALIFGGIVDKDKLVARANDMWLLETNLNENSISDLNKIGYLNETRIGNYVIERLLGRGGQASVFLVKDESNNNNHYALKRMDIIFNDNIGRNKSIASDSVFNEIFILQQLKHVNILPTLSFFLEKRMLNSSIEADSNSDSNGMIALVLNIIMPYCESGDLSVFYLKKVNYWKKLGNFNELEMIEWLLQISLALQYIHDRNIIHRDLKPSNVFVTFENSKDPTMKLSDFGLAKNVQSSLAKTQCGTLLYLAPEIYNEDVYSEKVDIWAFGCIVAFFLFSGQLRIDLKIPSNKKKLEDLFKPSNNVTLVQKLIGKEEYLQIIYDCIEIEPEKRPNANQLVKRLQNLQERVKLTLNEKLESIKLSATTTNTTTNSNDTTNTTTNISDTNTTNSNDNSHGNDDNSKNMENNSSSSEDVDKINQVEYETSPMNAEIIQELNEHETFEIVNSEDLSSSIDNYSQPNISSTTVAPTATNKLEVHEKLEEIWVEIQAMLFKLEKENLLTEEQVDELSLAVINSHVGIKRFYLAVVKNCGHDEEVFREEMTRQFKRFLKLRKLD